jgi:hypothetical protein
MKIVNKELIPGFCFLKFKYIAFKIILHAFYEDEIIYSVPAECSGIIAQYFLPED